VTTTTAKLVTATFAVEGGASYSLAVSKTGNSTGTVSSTPVGIDCGSTCSHSFDENTEVMLLAIADPGSTFTGWSGACTGMQTPCAVTMDSDKAVVANFDLSGGGATYTLTVSKTGSGTGTVSSNPAGINCGSDCAENFPEDTDVTLTASASAGSVFSAWGGACAGTQSTCNLTMDGAKSATASFAHSGGGSANVVSRSYAGTDCGAFINSQADKLERQQARIYNPASNPQSLWVICPLAAPVAAGGNHSGAVPGAWDFIDGRVNIFWNTGAANGSRVDCAIRQYGFDNTHLPGVSQAGVLSVTTLASTFSAAAAPYVDGVDFALSSPQGGFNYMTASCLLPPGAGVNGIEVEFGAAP